MPEASRPAQASHSDWLRPAAIPRRSGARAAPLAPGTGSAFGLGKDWFGGSASAHSPAAAAFGVAVWPAGVPRQTGSRRRIDRSARRHRQFALLDQRGPLRDGRRQRRRRAAAARAPRRANGRPVGPGASPHAGTAPETWRRPVDDVVDDGPVVDVGEDDVVRRRRHIDRRPHVDRYRHKDRLRQDEQPDRWRRWLQHDEILRRRRQVVHRRRRRRREVELGIAERQHGTIDIDELVRRRRRHIVVDDIECRRRLERRGENGKAAARIGGMRPARIASQIRPIGVRRVGAVGAAPGDRFAPRRRRSPSPASPADRWDRRRGNPRSLAACRAPPPRHRLPARRDRGSACRGWRRPDLAAPARGASGARSKNMKGASTFWLSQGTCAPLLALVDAKPHAVENLRQRQSAGPDHLGQRLGVDAVRSLLGRRDRAGRRVERDQHVRIRLHQCEPACDLLPP